MTQLERQIRTSQHRLWLNRWLRGVTYAITMAACLFGIVVLIHRLFALSIPVGLVGTGLVGAAVVAATIWLVVRRESEAYAAAALDEAAGLRERISSGRYCGNVDDPFAQAVVADAERVSGSISARQHIRLTAPQSWPWAVLALAVAACMFLIPRGLMQSTEADEPERTMAEAQQVEQVVKELSNAFQPLIAEDPELADLERELEEMKRKRGDPAQRPEDLRNKALTKIDKLHDALKQKRQDRQYDATKSLRRMLRSLQPPKDSSAPTKKLHEALSKGDFKTAKEEIKKLQEQLATLKSEDDKEMVKKLGEQLDNIAKQIEKAAERDKSVEEKLKKAGFDKQEAKRMAEDLKKKDPDQAKKDLQKELEKKGMSKEQAEQMAQQMAKQQSAQSMAQNLSKAMQQCSSCKSGQTGEAMQGMTAAADQLSQLEQMEQEMSQLESMMQAAQDAKNGLGKPCPKCGKPG